MKKALNLILAMSVGGLVLQSCSRLGCMDENAENYDSKATEDNGECVFKEGCIDAKASNYDADAKKDNGSCTYKGSALFWASEEGTSSKITVRVADSEKGSYVSAGSISAFQNTSPDCSAKGFVTTSKVEGKYYYKADRSDGSESWEGNFDVLKDQCSKVYLEPKLFISARHWVNGSTSGSNANKIDITNLCDDSYTVNLIGPTNLAISISSRGSYYKANIKDGTYSIKISRVTGPASSRYCTGADNLIENVVIKGSQTLNLSIGS